MKKKETRGMRNNNPCNIRISTDKFQGEVQPSQDKESAFRVLRTYINNYKCDTIRKIISRWAPKSENHTENYIKVVSERSGIPENDPVYPDNREMMVRIVAAMSYIENGREAVMSDVIRGWELL